MISWQTQIIITGRKQKFGFLYGTFGFLFKFIDIRKIIKKLFNLHKTTNIYKNDFSAYYFKRIKQRLLRTIIFS